MGRICVFGDSITWGAWDTENGGWVGLLKTAGMRRATLPDKQDYKYSAVYNCGVSGDRLADVIRRFDIEVAARPPLTIVIAIGINDSFHNGVETDFAVFANQYDELIKRAQQHTEDIVLVTPTNVDESRREHDYTNHSIVKYVEIVRTLATTHNLACADVFGALNSDDLKPDGLHPGTQGHQKLFNLISPVIFGLTSAS